MTLIVTAGWSEEGRHRAGEYVVRIAPTALQVFLDPQFEQQYRTIEQLNGCPDVPVPTLVGFESDPALMGAPFWVMARIRGEAPADWPPYNRSGILADATSTEREKLWHSAVETLGAIHRVPATDFSFLHEGAVNTSPLDELVSYWHTSLIWASQGRQAETLEALYDWLYARRPSDALPGLSWGDARIGNMLFRDWRWGLLHE